jgi:predicted AAA+ superfamily ATPase
MIKVQTVIDFIERENNIKLAEYQKEIVDHIIRGDIIYTPRGCGRSTLYKGYAKFIEKEIAPSVDYEIGINNFDKIIKYDELATVDASRIYNLEANEGYKKSDIKHFNKEFNCSY